MITEEALKTAISCLARHARNHQPVEAMRLIVDKNEGVTVIIAITPKGGEILMGMARAITAMNAMEAAGKGVCPLCGQLLLGTDGRMLMTPTGAVRCCTACYTKPESQVAP